MALRRTAARRRAAPRRLPLQGATPGASPRPPVDGPARASAAPTGARPQTARRRRPRPRARRCRRRARDDHDRYVARRLLLELRPARGLRRAIAEHLLAGAVAARRRPRGRAARARPAQLRRRAALRARRARRRRGAVPRRPAPGPRAARRRSATCGVQPAAAGHGAPRACPQALRALRDLGPRAQRVAAARAPAEGLTLSLCMIVKDEEAMLAALPGRRRATPSTR